MRVKIGLECHVQLNSKSKMFCGCRNPVNLAEEPEPNTLLCETCLGLPGSKPRANRAVVEMALKVAVALNCAIARETFFSRKTYFYPDMSKNFQITQYEVPIAKDGHVISSGRKVRIRRVHMEEDPSKIVHVGGLGGRYTLLDYNRAGIPLIEIVTEPDFSSPAEARLFLQKLASILEYLGVYDSSSKAVIKSDANVSLSGGKRVEVKNITGTKEIEQALNYEITRQRSVIKRGGKIVQSTRMWNPDTGVTKEMRTKETEEDYGYIMETDLTKIEVTKNKITDIKKKSPELPDQKYSRFIKRFHIKPKVAEALVSELDLANLFEQAARKVDPKLASIWIAGYLKKTLNYNNLRFRDSGLKSEWIIEWLKSIKKGEFTDRNAELLIRKMVDDKKDPETTRKKYGIGKRFSIVLTEGISIRDSVKRKRIKTFTADAVIVTEIECKIRKILEGNSKAVNDYKSGEEKALHFLVGLVMRETGGQVDANIAKKIILKIISKSK